MIVPQPHWNWRKLIYTAVVLDFQAVTVAAAAERAVAEILDFESVALNIVNRFIIEL